MALKPERQIDGWNIDLTLSVAADAGCVLTLATGGSGVAQGDSAGTATLSSNSSGTIVAGMLMLPFVDVDETLYHRNFHTCEQMLGEPAPIATRGWAVTNKVIGSPTKGQTAYLTSSGNITPTQGPGGTTDTPKFGRFESIKDADGYAKVSFSLPVI